MQRYLFAFFNYNRIKVFSSPTVETVSETMFFDNKSSIETGRR